MLIFPLLNKNIFMRKYLFLLSLIFVLNSCKDEKDNKPKEENTPERKAPERTKPNEVSFQFQKTKTFLATNPTEKQLQIIYAVNRMDKANLTKKDSIIVPTDLTGDVEFYLPFPLEMDYLKDIKKIIYFSYPTQSFATYEYGYLTYAGPTNMGSKKNQTPTGLFFANWKAEETISTVDDEWKLLWNFNIANKLGVGWHQYELPGYPASHSCLRLTETDAKFLYTWADQWILKDDQNVSVKGTPTIVFGSYDFDGPKAWYALVKNPKALNISESDIKNTTKPFLEEILAEQKKRNSNS